MATPDDPRDLGLTPRLGRFIDVQFGSDGAEARRLLQGFVMGIAPRSIDDPAAAERLAAAAVLDARGELVVVRGAIDVGVRDWRDLLVWSGLGNGDWAQVLDDRLGPATERLQK